MKIIFFGTPEPAVTILNSLWESEHSILSVVTQPDRRQGRSKKLIEPPVKKFALEKGLDYFQPEKVRTRTFRELIARQKPDVMVVVAYGRILGKRLMDEMPYGAINVHFSLLPKYRGAAPVQWAIANREAITGVTTMQMNARLDEGDVLLQKTVQLTGKEHTPELMKTLAEVSQSLLLETLVGMEKKSITPLPQNHEEASFAPIIRREDGWLHPSMAAEAIDAAVRAFDPWPGVWMQSNGKRIRLCVTEPQAADQHGSIGEILKTDEGLALQCGEGTTLQLKALQLEGRKVVTATEALNGRIVQPGQRFEPIQSVS